VITSLICMYLIAGAALQEHGPSAPVEASYRIERGAGELPILVPRSETLSFDVHLELGILGSPRVGKVTIKTRVEPIEASPLLAAGVGAGAGAGLEASREPAGERVVFEAIAEGDYKVYEVREVLTTILLPQDWPAVVHRKVQTGTESRRRELLLGVREGVFTGEYRSDRHCDGCTSRAHYLKPAWPWQSEKHCESCKRAEHREWREPRSEPAPEGAIDMLSAVQLARTMVAQGEQRLTFTVLDKLTPWVIDLKRGKSERQEVAAGTFDAVEIRISTRPPPDAEGRDEDFAGLFGIHGTISMWFDQSAGYPVLITGSVPVGPLTLSARVELASVR